MSLELGIGVAVPWLAIQLERTRFFAASTQYGPRQRAAFEHFGELIAESLKLAALLVFGALVSVEFLREIFWQGWVFAIVALVARQTAGNWPCCSFGPELSDTRIYQGAAGTT